MCKTSEDYDKATADLTATALRNWKAKKDVSNPALTSLEGEWCGRHDETEVRVHFRNKKDGSIGKATYAWARILKGPFGEEGYVMKYTLVPKSVDDDLLSIAAINDRGRQDNWALARKHMNLITQRGVFPITKSCKGYWKE